MLAWRDKEFSKGTGTRTISLTAVFLGTIYSVAAQPPVAIGDYLANLGYPNQITVGPDGALWYTSPQANSIGRMTVAGTNPKVYPIPTAYSEVTPSSPVRTWRSGSSSQVETK